MRLLCACATLLPLLLSCWSPASGERRGCVDWTLGLENTVCCRKCHPGNHLVNKCGKNPGTMCKPCTEGFYVADPLELQCSVCTKCELPQVEKSPCTKSKDTQCGCMEGYFCGNQECSFCMKECGEGEEQFERDCRPCKPGTFNNQTNQKCIPWKKSCPKGWVIETSGTATQDNKCTFSNEIVPVPVINPGRKGIAAVILRRRFKRSTFQTPVKEGLRSEESQAMRVEQEECGYCQPQQEQSGSSESISTQDSQDKLLPV
ncbi:tumor necrosis factor receptor superfamily member 14-like isoform X2 [Denticeps clupeoides]|uniref:tumor necrosis factor receptor superfamily member 14-like isoform X2 n=1 Tax=Denticeps clupeoides TaxID=299321 RepID=UPI0010A3C1BC|nr:tumor necrosis factor receptor superfamily member 14-like isoform X2 [Denticeps clupeoides]